MFFGSSETSCEVRFTKNVFYPGEIVDIMLDCDNSKCANKVKHFDIKLFRQLRCRESKKGHYKTFDTLVKNLTEPGCAAKTHE